MASLVVLNFFPAFAPAASGGEMRLGSLYRALSRTHDIVILSSTDFGARFEEIAHTPRLTELRFPKDHLWRAAYAALAGAQVTGELSGLAFATAVGDPRCELTIEARRRAATADLVIHEFPYSEPIFADGCPCPEIYNSHNFEASLLSSIAGGAGFEDALLKLMRLEGNLVKRAHRVFATSEPDAEKFRLFYGANAAKIALCPNGFDVHELHAVVASRQRRGARDGRPACLFFIGSAHHPNVEAAAFLVRLAAELPECRIVLAGGVCRAMADRPLPPNLELLGVLEPADKLRLLAEADLFLNPVQLGSGTSLKALEALGAGIPMVSTAEGVRGLELVAGIDCEIVPRAEFAATIRRLLADEARCDSLAAAGLARARERFSWDRIARSLGALLSAPVVEQAEPLPLLLALNDYPVLEPGSGGVARVRNLLLQVDSDVVIVSFGPTCEIALIAPRVLHVTLPKTAAHASFEAAVNHGEAITVDDGVASLFVGSNRAVMEVVAAVACRAGAVVFEHPYMAPLLDVITAVRPDLPVIYSAHNVESAHKTELLRTHRIGGALSGYVAELERRLVLRAALVVCCTDADAAHFQAAGARTIVVQNGCSVPDEVVLRAARQGHTATPGPRIGFLGSSHRPNVEAAEFIARELAPAFPDATFEMVGSVCTALTVSLPENIVLHGLVTESRKSDILAAWDIALNPVEAGGGSSLKLPDYMAHGLVTLNTPCGARGFAVDRCDAGLIVQRPEFRSALARMIGACETSARQGLNARRHAVAELSWAAVTVGYRQALRALQSEPPSTRARRLLVVTYRYTEPSLGGAEEYLIEILKRLRPRFGTVDLAAIDVEGITNEHHFGCRVTAPSGGAARRVGSLFDRMRFFEPEQLDEAQMLARTRNLERAWTREEHTLLNPFLADLAIPNRLRLFGGFYWPENHGGMVRRWTSPIFSFLLPRRASAFQIAGYAACDKTLRITLLSTTSGGEREALASYQTPLASSFNRTFSLPPCTSAECTVLLRCEVDEHQAAGDHRPFGVLLESAAVWVDGVDGGAVGDPHCGIAPLEMSRADLSEEIDEELRTAQFERWLAALHDTASRRDAAIDGEFAAVRGPHSRTLQTWLADHAQDYDCVLVQGIPFDVIPSTVETLAALQRRPRVVALPHFHGDDRFYHWRRYFDSFAAADATLVFSPSIARQLGQRGTFAVVPGGGVRADEHGDPAAIAAFRAIHGSTKPFYLSLGRKIASKGYEQTIRAHQALRNAAVDVDLVLIGPDEDGRAVTGDGVYYLGQQPREVIRGALDACLGLVTMSRSESFGIVLCEAWLFGKPVVANRACYSFRELVQEGESGILVTTDAELTAAMARLAADPALRARLGQRGFEAVVDRFTWERVAAACYESLAPTSVAQLKFPVAAPLRPPLDGAEAVAAAPSGTKLRIVHSA